MVAIAHYSITGQTDAFVAKTGLNSHRIDDAYPQYDMNEDYVLIVPSYQDFMMDSIVDFLNYGTNKKHLIGLIGNGNRGFNNYFAQTAKKISATLKVPILYLFEFRGTPTDVENVRHLMAALNQGQTPTPLKKKKVLDNISFLNDYKKEKHE